MNHSVIYVDVMVMELGGDTHLGYGILGVKQSGIWYMGPTNLGYGIWEIIWDMGAESIIFPLKTHRVAYM